MSKKNLAKFYLLSVFLKSVFSLFSEVQLSNRMYGVISTILMVVITILLSVVTWFTLPYLSGKDSVFDIEVETDYLELSSFNGVSYPRWEVSNAIFHDGCGEENRNLTGTIQFLNSSEMEFKVNSKRHLEITIVNDDGVGNLLSNSKSTPLSDCVVLVFENTGQFVFPIDGVVSVGHEIVPMTYDATILKSGTVTVADKRIFSGEYYQNEPVTLSLGDKFLIKDPVSQSSGFVYFDKGGSMYVSYRVKGESGFIQRYKSETIVVRNSVWDKILKDDLLTFMWLLILPLIGLLRTVVLLRR